MADHTHGEMDAEVHEQTFENFVKYVGRGIIVILCILIFLALVDG